MNPNAQIKVTILEAKPDERSGEFKNDRGENVAYTTRKQKAKAETPDGFAYPYEVRLDNGQPPYPVGEYVMDTVAMFAVNKGAHNFSKFAVLRPLEKAAK